MTDENNKKFNLELDESVKAKLKKIIVEKPVIKNKPECKEKSFRSDFSSIKMTELEARKSIHSRKPISFNSSNSIYKKNNDFFTGINSYTGNISRSFQGNTSYSKSSVSSNIGYSSSFAPSGSGYSGVSSPAMVSSPSANYAPATLQTRGCCGNGCCPIGRARLAQSRASMMNKY